VANYTEINGLLNERLAELSDLPTWSRENQYIEPEDDDLYFETQLVPADSENPFLGKDVPTYESGTFIVKVSPVTGSGWGYAYEWVDKIVEQFKRGTILTTSSEDITVRIRKAYPVPGFYGDKGRYKIPIHIEYFSYVDI
jgi:hypothetical protein